MRGTVNTVLSRDDQGAFLNFARDVYESGFRYTGDRNRMPVYPFLQAAFYNPAMSAEAFFQQGKQLNILLSLVCLGGLFLGFKRFLPLHDAVNLTLIAAFSIFIFKSAYFQSELLFYTLNFFCFVLMALLLVRPGVMLALLTGAALGLAHLTKASVLPGLILFVGVALLKPFLVRLHSPGPAVWLRSFKRSILVNAAGAGLVGVAFLGVVFPYILESKQVFGRYFYNVNSTFYMWYNSWEQAKAGTRAHGDRVGWPDLPPDEIPGPAKYFREHTPLQVLARLGDGLAFQFSVLRDQYGVFNYPVLLSSFLVAFIALDFRRFRDLLGEHLPLVLFGVLYFSLYLLLYAWYKPISDGPRFTFTLIIPFLFAALVAIHHLTGPGKSHEGVPPPWGRFRRASLASSVITIFLLVDIYFVLTSLIKSGYFGG